MIWNEDVILIEIGIEYVDGNAIGNGNTFSEFLDTDVKVKAFLSQLHFAIENDNRFKYDFIQYHQQGRGGDGTIFARQRGFVLLDELGILIGANITGGHKNAILDIFNANDVGITRLTFFNRFLNQKFGQTEDGARFYDDEWSPV